jgi:hypothetical protein
MLTGGCHCGRVAYEVHGKLGVVTYCHCETCRKAQGGAFVAAAPARRKYVRLVRGEDAITEYESSAGKFRAFCRFCGPPLYSRRPADPEIVRIRLGSLDGDPERRPAAHIFVGEKAPWFTITDDLPRSAENGTDLVGVHPPAAKV